MTKMLPMTTLSLDQQLPTLTENADEELRRARLALSTIFSNAQVNESQWWSQRQLADRYLTMLQGNPVSWLVCDRLLLEEDSNDPQEVMLQQQRRFYAAQTLHTKCRAFIDELPPQSLQSLRDSLLAHLNRYSTGNETALTIRLAMCVSALAVQMRWITIANDLLQNPSDSRVVLYVLRALPEECVSERLLLLNEDDRFAMRDHLVESAPSVFQFLRSNMKEQEVYRVFETFLTWIRYVPVLPSALVGEPLLTGSVEALCRNQYLEPAADVVVETLRMYPSHHYGNEALVNMMIPLLSQLPLEDALKSDDEDVQRAYCRVITEMGESYMSLILSEHYKEASKLVEWVLRCTGIADIEIASITLHFWYRMVTDLEMIDPYEWRQELVDAYTPHLLKLVDICATSLMRFPQDVDELPEDIVEDLKRHRFYVAETIEDCCRLVGGHNILQAIGRILRQEIQAVTTHQNGDWQGIESCMACIESIHQFIPSDEADFLPLCFNIIPRLPQNVPQLRSASSKMIGKFASWLSVHADLLQPLLPYLAQGLSIPECAAAAAVAIRELCECSNQTFALAGPVLQLYTEVASTPGRLELSNELQVLEGACRALSRQIHDTRDPGISFLQQLANPIGARFALAVSDPNATARKLIPEIDRFTVIIQHLLLPYDPQSRHPLLELVSSIWGLLDSATKRFPHDFLLAEKICRLHKHSLRKCGDKAYAPMLDALIQQLVQSYEQSHQSPFLYAGSICVTEYGMNPDYSQHLFEMIAAMSKTTFSFLRVREDFVNHPDVVEEFFYLMGRVMTHCADRLVQSPLFESLFNCAAVAMPIDHPGANKGTMNFLEETISYGLRLREQHRPDSQAALERVLSEQGEAIVRNIVLALIGDLPSHNNQIPVFLWKLNLLCPGLLVQWLSSSFASATLPERLTSDFMANLDSGLARDEFSLAVRSFQSICERERRFRRLRSNFSSSG